MPWKKTYPMKQREEFVLKALQPQVNFSELCRQFGISRKTGYKWVNRFRERGLRGLEELAHGPAPGRRPLRCSADAVVEILNLRRSQPTWGPKKLRKVLLRSWDASEVPSERTISRVLRHAGLVAPRRARPRRWLTSNGGVSVVVEKPNDLWTVDFKGWWRSKNGKKCEPLTVRDQHSRFILSVELVNSPSVRDVRDVFEGLFEAYGLPFAIQSDNGAPFASTRGLAGLTRLSAWWVSLGIRYVRGRVGCPQDNGAHERMHLDMARELERYPAWNRRQQQEHCDRWRHEFNHHRPHQALSLETPAKVYRKSPRAYPDVDPELSYPSRMVVRRVSSCGTMRYMGYQRLLTNALSGYNVGVEPMEGKEFRVWFSDLCLGVGKLPWTLPLRPWHPKEEGGL